MCAMYKADGIKAVDSFARELSQRGVTWELRPRPVLAPEITSFTHISSFDVENPDSIIDAANYIALRGKHVIFAPMELPAVIDQKEYAGPNCRIPIARLIRYFDIYAFKARMRVDLLFKFDPPAIEPAAEAPAGPADPLVA